MPVGQFKIGLIARESKPHLTNAVIGDPRIHDQEWAKREGVVAFAGYPLIVEDRVVGVVAVFARHQLTETTLQAIASVADRIALAVQRKRAEEAVRRAEEKYRGIFEHAIEGIFQTTLDGRYLSANPALARIFGYDSPSELKTATMDIKRQIYVDPKRREEFVDFLEKRDALVGFESQIRRKDGSVTWISENARAVRGTNGELLYYEGTVEDITSRKQAETALHLSDRVFENSPQYIAIIGNDYVYKKVNPSLARAFGLSPEDIVGKQVADLIEHDIFESIVKQHLDRCLAGEEVIAGSSMIMRFPYPRFMAMNYSPLRSSTNDVEGVILICHDLTEERRALDEKRKSERALQESREELRALTAQLLTVQEEERRRLSRELHDDTLQRLVMLAQEVGVLEWNLPSSSESIKAQLMPLRDKMMALATDMRRLAYQLHPSILDDLGLVIAIEAFVEEFMKREGIKVQFTHKFLPESIPSEPASCLYRVTQEGLRNVAKHAQTSHALVRLVSIKGGIGLLIKDFGTGFHRGSIKEQKKGLGIISMRERVRLLNGKFSINSQLARGTKVKVWIPLQEKSDEGSTYSLGR